MLTVGSTTLCHNAYYMLFTMPFAIVIFAGVSPDEACDWGEPECIPLPNSPCCTSSCKLRPQGSACASQGEPSLRSMFNGILESACRGPGVCSGVEDACVVPTVPNFRAKTGAVPCRVPGSNAEGECFNGFCNKLQTTCLRYLSMGYCCDSGLQVDDLKKTVPPYAVTSEITVRESDHDYSIRNFDYPNVVKVYPVAPECLSDGKLSSYACRKGAGWGDPVSRPCGRSLGECRRANPNLFQEVNCKLLPFWSTCPAPTHMTINECEDIRTCDKKRLPKGTPCNVNQECTTPEVCDGTAPTCTNVVATNAGRSCHNGKGTCENGKCKVSNQCDDKSSVNYCESTDPIDQPCCENCVISAPDTSCAIDTTGAAQGVCNAAGRCEMKKFCHDPNNKKCTAGACCNLATCVFKPVGTDCAVGTDVCQGTFACTGTSKDCLPKLLENGITCSKPTLGITEGKCREGVCMCDPAIDDCCDGKTGRPFIDTERVCKNACSSAKSKCDGQSATCPHAGDWLKGKYCSTDRKCGRIPDDGCLPSLCGTSDSKCVGGDCCDIPNCRYKLKGEKCAPTCHQATTCSGDSADCPLNSYTMLLPDKTPCGIANSKMCFKGLCIPPCNRDSICCNKYTGLPAEDANECDEKLECYKPATCDVSQGTCPSQTVWNPDTSCSKGAGKCGHDYSFGCVLTTPAPPQVCFGLLSCDPASDPQCCDRTKCKKNDLTPCTLPASYVPKLGSSHSGECYDGRCASICEKRGVCTNPGSECCDANCQPHQIGLTCGNGLGKCSARGTCEQAICPLFQDSNSGTTLKGCECRDTLHACQVCCEPTANLTMLAQDPSNQCRPVGTFVSGPQVLSDAHIPAAQTVLNAGTQCLTYGQCDATGGVCKPNYTAFTPPPTAATQPASTATGVTDAVTPKPIGKRVSPALLARVAYLAGKEGKPGATVPPTPSLRERFAQAGALQMIAMDIFYVLWKFCQACVLF